MIMIICITITINTITHLLFQWPRAIWMLPNGSMCDLQHASLCRLSILFVDILASHIHHEHHNEQYQDVANLHRHHHESQKSAQHVVG